MDSMVLGEAEVDYDILWRRGRSEYVYIYILAFSSYPPF